MITRYYQPTDAAKQVRVQQAFQQRSLLFEAFFRANFEQVPPDAVQAAVGMLQTGDWLLAQESLMYAPHGGRNSTPVFYCIAPDPQTLDTMCATIFKTSVKVKLLVREGSAEQEAAQIAGFRKVGVFESEALLGGQLMNMVALERFHPEWGAPAGEDLEVLPTSEDANVSRVWE